MARVKLILPTNKHATIRIPVRITDMNYGNHMGNDTFVSVLHEARVQWLAGGGFSELDVGGTSLIMGDLAVEYKSEVHYGDELFVTIFIGEVSGLSFEVFYEIKNQNEQLVAKAKTGLVCYDYNLKKVTAVPEQFAAFLKPE